MKTPIKPEDIREGDLIRWEAGDNRVVQASEYFASRDGAAWAKIAAGGQHYLLDRPATKADLPTELTLGIVEVSRLESPSGSGGVVVGYLRERFAGVQIAPHGYWDRDFITSFTEAIAVPKDALDELRAAHRDMARGTYEQAYRNLHSAVAYFLSRGDQ